jgi:hypothetical protein
MYYYRYPLQYGGPSDEGCPGRLLQEEPSIEYEHASTEWLRSKPHAMQAGLSATAPSQICCASRDPTSISVSSPLSLESYPVFLITGISSRCFCSPMASNVRMGRQMLSHHRERHSVIILCPATRFAINTIADPIIEQANSSDSKAIFYSERCGLPCAAFTSQFKSDRAFTDRTA